MKRFIEVCKRIIPRGKYNHSLKYYFRRYILPIILLLAAFLIGCLVASSYFIANPYRIELISEKPVEKTREVIKEVIVEVDVCGGKG